MWENQLNVGWSLINPMGISGEIYFSENGENLECGEVELNSEDGFRGSWINRKAEGFLPMG